MLEYAKKWAVHFTEENVMGFIKRCQKAQGYPLFTPLDKFYRCSCFGGEPITPGTIYFKDVPKDVADVLTVTVDRYDWLAHYFKTGKLAPHSSNIIIELDPSKENLERVEAQIKEASPDEQEKLLIFINNTRRTLGMPDYEEETLKQRVDTLIRYHFGGFGARMYALSGYLTILKDPAFSEVEKESAKKKAPENFAWIKRKYDQIPYSELSKSPFYDDLKPLFEFNKLLSALEEELKKKSWDFDKIESILSKSEKFGKEYTKAVNKYYMELTGKDLGAATVETRALMEYRSKEQIQDQARWLKEQGIKPNSFEKAAMDYYGVIIPEEEEPWRRLMDVIKELEKEHGLEVPEDIAIATATEVGIEKPEDLIYELKRDGILYSPANGLIARVEREKPPEVKEPWMMTKDEIREWDFPVPKGGASMTPKTVFSWAKEDYKTLYDLSKQKDQFRFNEVLGKGWEHEWKPMLHLKGKIAKNQPITIYRATEYDYIIPGSYVSESLEYAEGHLERILRGKGKILSTEVKPSDLMIYGDPHEFIYIPESVEAFHKPFIQKALKEGKPIPEKVLKDYPDLIEKTPEEEIPPELKPHAERAREYDTYEAYLESLKLPEYLDTDVLVKVFHDRDVVDVIGIIRSEMSYFEKIGRDWREWLRSFNTITVEDNRFCIYFSQRTTSPVVKRIVDKAKRRGFLWKPTNLCRTVKLTGFNTLREFWEAAQKKKVEEKEPKEEYARIIDRLRQLDVKIDKVPVIVAVGKTPTVVGKYDTYRLNVALGEISREDMLKFTTLTIKGKVLNVKKSTEAELLKIKLRKKLREEERREKQLKLREERRLETYEKKGDGESYKLEAPENPSKTTKLGDGEPISLRDKLQLAFLEKEG